MNELTPSPGRILLVEDDPQLADELAAMIDDLGFDVHIAASAEEGLDRLLVHSYLCLVAGEMLPGRRGTEMIEAVLRAGATLPCVLVASSGDASMDQALASGATAVVQTDSHRWLDELRAVLARIASPRSGTMWKVEPPTTPDALKGARS